MINVTVVRGNAFVWNSEDACKLREEHRIVGNLVGCLPRAPRQNCQLGLPLQLMPEEATILQENGVVRLIKYNGRKSIPDPKEIERFERTIENVHKEQMLLFKEERRRKIIEMGDQIIEGKRRKMAKVSSEDVVIDREQILKEELNKIDQLETPKDAYVVQLFRENPWIEHSVTELAVWNFPQTDVEVSKYIIYKDLWNKGNYLTPGCKFGGDYLVYQGDPMKFHASHVAVCIGRDETFTGYDIITKGRLGTIVKKTILLCSAVNDRDIKYISLKWTGMS